MKRLQNTIENKFLTSKAFGKVCVNEYINTIFLIPSLCRNRNRRMAEVLFIYLYLFIFIYLIFFV